VVSEFAQDLGDNRAAIADARDALLDELRGLNDGDLTRARRGGWSVQQVLRHVIDAEVAYTRVIAHLRGASLTVPDTTPDDVTTMRAAIDALERYRGMLTAAVDGVSEDVFYEMRTLGRDEYSVLSVLENVANHDHEHLQQIRQIVSAPT
jgi:uncharacterized damage-inducible protein DinB